MDRNQIEKTLKEILVKRVAGLAPEAIAPDADLAELGVDSLAFSWILADMEDSFDIVMVGADAMKLKTLSLAADYVEKHLAH